MTTTLQPRHRTPTSSSSNRQHNSNSAPTSTTPSRSSSHSNMNTNNNAQSIIHQPTSHSKSSNKRSSSRNTKSSHSSSNSVELPLSTTSPPTTTPPKSKQRPRKPNSHSTPSALSLQLASVSLDDPATPPSSKTKKSPRTQSQASPPSTEVELSKSAPSHPPQFLGQDEWDMPLASANGGSSLTWQQQEALAMGSRNPQPHSHSHSNMPSGSNTPRQSVRGGKNSERPNLNGSISDSGPSTHSHSNPNLTWQQQLLSTPRSSSPLKPSSKDSLTFGLSPLPLPSTPKRQPQGQVSLPQEERYAGPTFHNSPAPSSLPTPGFLLRRKVVAVE